MRCSVALSTLVIVALSSVGCGEDPDDAELEAALRQAQASGLNIGLVGVGADGGANPLGAGSPDGAAAEGPGGTRDPRLVGHWRKSTSMSGGGFGVVVDEHLYIHADGRFEHGDSKIAGGGPGSGFSGAGGSADNTVGQWSTRGDVVYVQGAGQPTWIPFARFYTDGTSLMFTTGDGQREVWKRVR